MIAPPAATNAAATIKAAAATCTKVTVICSTAEIARKLREMAGETNATYIFHKDGKWVEMMTGNAVALPSVVPAITVVLDDFATLSVAGPQSRATYQ